MALLRLAVLALLPLFISPTGAVEVIPQAADADAVVNADGSKDLRLEANLFIPDGGELLLSIEVPHEPIKLHSQGPAKITRVYSDHTDGKLGVGEVVDVFIQFTSAVQVTGAPSLLLRTGCHSSSCHIREVQRLRCQATKGKFALGFGPQKVGNVPWDASAKVFAAYVQRMNRIDRVKVKYSIDEDRACTFFGNNITITFESMNVAGVDGDLVEMTGDATNAVGDGSMLEHVMYAPMVTPSAWEIRKGVRVPDRRAQFVSQTAPDTLKFAYTVQAGDNSTRLEYASSDSLALSLRASGGARIFNAVSDVPANVILPPPGFAGDWERGLGSSLSANSALEIDATPPYVKYVTSPHVDGVFGIGEEILVHVVFSQPIVVSGLPTVVLETGTVDRIIPFNQVMIPDGHIAEFKYIVQAMDTSPDLTYTGTTALQLNGGSIRRKSTTPTTDAKLKLPVNGEKGSLSVNKNIIIDTTNPKILTITTTASNGTYTAGDTIPVIVTFDMPVVVTGVPQLLLNTGTVDLLPGHVIQAAPLPAASNTIIFPSVDHGLTTISSKGLQFSIGGQILTVNYVVGDAVTMLETYTGTRVDPTNLVSMPSVPIYTPGYRPAKYTSGSGTTSLVFLYSIQVGDVTANLDYVSTSALQIRSGSIRRLSTAPLTDADLTLSAPGRPNSLGFGAAIVINTDSPRVLQVNPVSRDGVYKAGDEIYFEVVFNLPVVIFPTASVLTNVVSAGVDRFAVYSKGSGTTSLEFKFECTAVDQAVSLDYQNAHSLRASYGSMSGWIRRKSASPMVPAVLSLPITGLTSKGIKIDQACERVIDVFTSHDEGTFGVGESIVFKILYSANVNVDTTSGTPTIATTTGSRAVYQSGTGTNTLSFVYIVQSADIPGRLAYSDIFSLKTSGAVITSATSSQLASTLLLLPEQTTLGSKLFKLFIQTSPPVVVAVSTTMQDRMLVAGDTILLSVSFNFPVEVAQGLSGAGIPSLLLNVGTGDGVASAFVNVVSNAVYFSFTVGTGQSSSKLKCFSRTALKCVGGNGMNKDASQNAGPPSAVVFHNRLFTSWAEMSAASSTRQIRVKSFGLSHFPPLSSFEDGGGVSSTVNFNSAMSADSPRLVLFASKLYLLWVEASAAVNNPTQIRVSVLTSRSTETSPAQWAFVDAKFAGNSGLNKAATENADGPHGLVHNGKLYIAWHESAAGVSQVRVSLYNGIDSSPEWTLVDGNQAASGLNYVSTQSATNVRLCSCASKGSSVKHLYAVWEESAAGTGIMQIRVAVQTGTDSLPNWIFIDGNGATGLNSNSQRVAKSPSIECLGNSNIVVAWHEVTTGTISAILVTKFNENLTSPQWMRLDNGKGLNLDANQAAQNVHLKVQSLGSAETLFATWDELSSVGAVNQIRVAAMSSTGTAPSWMFLDRGAKASAINDNVGHAASWPTLAFGQSDDSVYIVWQEEHSSGKLHVRSSVLKAPVKEWQPINQACVLRKSTNSATAVNLLLPEANAPGALDFNHSIRIEVPVPATAIPAPTASPNVIPRVLRVYSTTMDDTYTAGDTIIVLVKFSGNVQVDGKPVLGLNSNGEATYASGSGTNVLKFYYEVQAGDMSQDLDYASTTALQTLTNPVSRIRCSSCSGSGILADTTLPNPATTSSLSGSSALVIDTTLPTIVKVSSAQLSTAVGGVGYGPGDIVDIILFFSTDVTVVGSPSLSLNSGGTAAFTYAGYRQLIDVGVDAVTPLASGQFSIVYDEVVSGCIDFDDADSSASTSLKSNLLAFNAIARIGIISVTMTKKKNGNRFEIIFDSSKVVDVPLAIKTTTSDICDPLEPSLTAQEDVISRSTDNQVIFHYVVGAGDNAAVLRVSSTSVALDGGRAFIMRQASSPVLMANSILPASPGPDSLEATKTLKIDGTPAYILDIIPDSAAGTYGAGFPSTPSPSTVAPGEILFHLVFSRAVAVVGSPMAELATGSLQPSGVFVSNSYAKYVGQPRPDQVAFLYHVELDDYSANLAFARLNVLQNAKIYSASSTMSVRASTLLPRLLISSNAIIKIDAFSVPATVKLVSDHEDGVYGVGELIEIDVTFSKEVILLSGLNRNQDWHARFPVALEFQSNIYVMWTERDDIHEPTKSYLYLRVFSSITLDVVVTASVSPINRFANTFIEKVAMAVWKGNLYAAWDEGGLLYCAMFEGLNSALPWTLIPNMGANKNIAMTASEPVLLVYNLQLVLVWREKSFPTGGSKLVGQIRVAIRNDDVDAPLWIFHDGNQFDTGLNRNPLMDAGDPTSVVYRGRMYVSWSEMTADGANEIVIARRNIQTRDISTWTYLNALPSTYPAYSFLSSYKPQFAVRRKGIEDMALLISWYRDTVTSNVSEVITGQVLDLDWEASVTGSIPQTISAAESNSTFDQASPNSMEQQYVTCGDNVYASWLDLAENSDNGISDDAYVVKLAILPAGSDAYTGWIPAVKEKNLNHNSKYDSVDSFLVCSTSADLTPQAGLLWTEFDGYSIKLRIRHYSQVPRIPGIASISFGEITAGTPLLMLATQSSPPGFAVGIDKSGTTATTLRFMYIVQPGESSPRLEILGSNALTLNGAIIRDVYGQVPDVTLFSSASDRRSLSYNNQLIIDTTPPTVVSVTSTNPSGEYGVGQLFQIQITFTFPVVVIQGDTSSVPTLALRSDELHLLRSSQGTATYVGGSGSAVLIFEYTSTQLDYCEHLDYMDSNSLSLNGGGWAIKRNATRPTADAILTLPPLKTSNSLSGSRMIVIKPTQPSVVEVTSPILDGTYYPGDIIFVDVVFTLPVMVFGFPALLLGTGNGPSRAFVVSGNGTTTLRFKYVISIGDSSARLDVMDDRVGDDQPYFVMSLELTGYAEIKRASTNPYTTAVTVLPAPGLVGSLSYRKHIVVDSTSPVVTSTQSPMADGTYDIGEQIDILIVFSRRVVVIGVPELILNVRAPSTRTAVYTDGSGTNSLRFAYITREEDTTGNVALDIMDEDSLILRPLLAGMELLQDPAQILCYSAKPVLPVDLTLPTPGIAVRADAALSLVGNNQKIFIRTDGFRVQAIDADVPSGVYSPGHRIVITVVLTGPAIVQGSPRLQLNSNTATYARYIAGTGTRTLQFEYIVATGDNCLVLDAASQNALDLNGGVISDTDGIYAPLKLGAPSKPGSLSFKYQIAITSTPPFIKYVYCKNNNGNYGVGDTLQVAVQFSRKITLQNPLVGPSLLLQFDSGSRAATYASGDKSDFLVFTTQILNGDMSARLEYASRNALTGAVLALSTTPTLPANLQLPDPGEGGSLSASSAIGVVSTPPSVVDVSAAAPNGTYGFLDQIHIHVRFSFPVYVSASASQSCTITLSIGDIEYRKAIYVGGSTTALLDFVYTVDSGDQSSLLDYASSDSLQCSILQSTTAPSLVATNTLPLPGAIGSLSFASILRIDALSPRILSASSGIANGIYGAGHLVDITITFSEAVLISNGGTPRLRLAIGPNAAVDGMADSTSERFAAYTGGSGSNVLTFSYTSREGDMAQPLEYSSIDALSMISSGAQASVVVSKLNQYRIASLRLPVPGTTGSLSNNCDIHIDTLEPPRVLSVGSSMPDGVYTAGDTIALTVAFSTPIIVTGPAPTLLLETGNPNTVDLAKKAVYVSGSGTSILLFEYQIQIGDSVDRLEYKRCPVSERKFPKQRKWDKLVTCSSTANALQLGGIGSSIKRSSTFPVTDAVLDLPEVSEWSEIRFRTSYDDIVYVTQVGQRTGIVKGATSVVEPLVNERTISHQRAAVNIYSNGIPDHYSNLLDHIKEEKYFVELLRFPTQKSHPLSASRAPNEFIGILLNGILFKSSNASAHKTDECGGAIDADKRYFYVALPTCYLAAAREPRNTGLTSHLPSILIGYALDGFPVYGYYDESGKLPDDLDECHGRIRLDGQYGYHLVPPTASGKSPFMPCLKGADATAPAKTQLSVFRYPAVISAVEGLSLSALSQFNGFVIDENPTSLHTAAWLNPEGVSVVFTATTVIVRSTGVPAANSSFGPFPNAHNRFAVHEQDYVFQFPRDPVLSATTTTLPVDKPIGVMLNGVPFFSSNSDKYGGNVMNSSNHAYVLLDKCNGLVDAGGDYRYYAAPDCLLMELGDAAGNPSPLVGFAFDGFPLYGPYNEHGQVPNDLDECNGRIGDDGTYRYHVTLTTPYLLGCFHGTPATSQVSLDAAADLYRSLSFAHVLRINTDRPEVEHIFTNKQPGTYVAGESADIVVQWSTPIQVDLTGGLPSIEIQNSSRVAVYEPSRSTNELSVFLLKVKSDDVDLEDFSYDPHAAIKLNGARIRRSAMRPTLDAVLNLIPTDLEDTNLMRTRTSGLSSKFQIISGLRVELRGLYHPRAKDLRARIFNGQRQSAIFDGCCTLRDAFGIPDTPDVLTNRAQLAADPRNPTSGVGWDYSFSDFHDVRNLAQDGGATALQSSTSGKCAAMNAIDGKIRGSSVSTQTVARTLSSTNSNESTWWELRLVESSNIGTVRVWIPDRDPTIPASVFTLTVNSNDGISSVTGDFTLVFTTSNQNQVSTASISYNAVAMIADENSRVTTPGIGFGESIQAKLLALGNTVPRVFITREPRNAVLSANGAFTWHITFIDDSQPNRSIEGIPALSVGVNRVCGGTGIVKLAVPLSINDDSDPVVYRDEQASPTSTSTKVKDSQQSMFPFWVMLFDSTTVMDFESFTDAYSRAVFSYRVDASQANRSVVSVVPPLGTAAQYIRIVAELPRGVLTISEVEVFAEQNHVLSQYPGGTPVRPVYHPGAKAWSPEEPFRYAFGGMPSDGLWTLAIADTAANGSMQARSNATAGGLSDWVLHITNEAGETHAYYMDFQAQLHALPRYGTLYVALDETERDHLDIDRNGLLDSMEADAYLRRYSPNNYIELPTLARNRELTNYLLSYEQFGGVQVLRDASERQKRLPSQVCDASCLSAIKMDPYFYVGLEGDVALKLLRVVGDRIVKYVPQTGFRGSDAFTFSVAVGGEASRVLGTIQLTVKDCEDPECRMSSFFVHRSGR